MTLIFAGTSFIFGLDDIARACRNRGWNAVFVEAPFIQRYGFMNDASGGQQPCADVVYSDDWDALQEHAAPDAVLIPLSEYWISRCTDAGIPFAVGPGPDALRASRSKTFLYETLSAAGIPVPATYADLQAARSAIAAGSRIVVKPDGLFSGYGVEIVGPENAGDLEMHALKAAGLKNNATKLFQVESTDVLLSEHIAGIEYSADCWICGGTVTVVRVCRKHLAVINDKPCTIAVEYIPVPDTHRDPLAAWCRTLFGADDMSFAQFDYIDRGSDLVPIDFACRVGGGMKTLLSTAGCCYAAAIAKEPLVPVDAGGAHPMLVNFLTTTSGYLTTDAATLPAAAAYTTTGKLTVYKHPGDYVTSNPSSAASRLADLVTWTAEAPAPETLGAFVLGAEHVRRGK
ncbi:MAG: ATP-grasp domain-containing protein [Treponemataceae bacterium]|nr:ATP-grasp domain-containing protein [Treponemataceae bacterium]